MLSIAHPMEMTIQTKALQLGGKLPGHGASEKAGILGFEKWTFLRDTADSSTYSILPLWDLHIRVKFSLLQSMLWHGKEKKNIKKKIENAAMWSPWTAKSALRWQQYYQIS